MSKSKVSFNKNWRIFLCVVFLAAIVYIIVRNINVFGNILIVLIGFGAVVLFHEFGHFIVAKLSDIKVEAFSIFMPPTLLGVRKTENGFRFRILPGLFSTESDETDESQETSDESGASRVGETEYRIGLIPFGGFVKMLGQDDTGPVKNIDDPRSFANKPVTTRIPIIAAGVTFNFISAIIIFMIVFLVGINLPPAVVGEVAPDSSAERAGLRPGDEVIEIAGKSIDLDFSNISIAAALSGKGQEIPLTVKHEDGSVEQFGLVAEQLPGQPLKAFGIGQPASLTIAKISDPNTLIEKTGLQHEDHITHVNGKDVQSYWQMEEIVKNTFAESVTLTAERIVSGEVNKIETQVRLTPDIEQDEVDISHVYFMVPRLRIFAVSSPRISILDKLLIKIGIKEKGVDEKAGLKSGDIILAIDDIDNPTYKELRDVAKKHEGKELPVKVLRTDPNGLEEALRVTVIPKREPVRNRVVIGILVVLDVEHPIVAKTIAVENGPQKLEIPRGATITAINGTKVSSFYDVAREIRQRSGKKIVLDYLIGQKSGKADFDIDTGDELVTIKSTFADLIPFDDLRKTYRASGPINAVAMGYRRTVMFIAQTYVTLKRLISGVVSPKHLMGPIGIITLSYRVVAQQPLIYYVYFLGLISAAIAVFNLLPLPPLDGGLIVLLLVEKIKGSAISERTQGAIAYAGWVLIGSLLLYVTFNDIVRNFLS